MHLHFRALEDVQRDLHAQLMLDIVRRYPYLLSWLIKQDIRRNKDTTSCIELHTLIIVKPDNVRDEFHRVVHDYEFRERARDLIPKERVNDPSPNAVLVLAPLI